MRDAGFDALITKGDSMGDRFIPSCRSAARSLSVLCIGAAICSTFSLI